jgi:hypothetical protein
MMKRARKLKQRIGLRIRRLFDTRLLKMDISLGKESYPRNDYEIA